MRSSTCSEAPESWLTPEQVNREFAYLPALRAAGRAAVAGRAETGPELAFLMLRLTEYLVVPVTTVPDGEDPTADSFVLEQARPLPAHRAHRGSHQGAAAGARGRDPTVSAAARPTLSSGKCALAPSEERAMWFKAPLTAVLALWRRRNRKRMHGGA